MTAGRSRDTFNWHLNTFLFWPRSVKTCLRGFANNKGTDKSAHPRRLISAFVIGFLKSIISKLAKSEISMFKLVSVAGELGRLV